MQEKNINLKYNDLISQIDKEISSENQNYNEGWCRPREKTAEILEALAQKRVNLIMHYANQDVVQAQLDLANVYFYDDLPASFYWYVRAAEQDSEEAILALVNTKYDIFLKCEKIKYTLEDRFKWAKKGAEIFGDNFKYYLSTIYLNGEGTEVNLEEALRLSKIVAKSKDVNSHIAETQCLKIEQRMLKDAKFTGKTFPNYLALLEQLKDFNDNEASIELATIYEEGTYVKQDYSKAFSIYSDIDTPYAKYKCGEFYENGLAVSKDILKAAALYYESAIGGNADGMKKLAQFYATGVIFIQDDYAAKYWSEKSLENS